MIKSSSPPIRAMVLNSRTDFFSCQNINKLEITVLAIVFILKYPQKTIHPLKLIKILFLSKDYNTKYKKYKNHRSFMVYTLKIYFVFNNDW